MNIDDLKKVTVNRDLLAEIFKVDVRSITNYVTLYGMPKDERGEYPLFDCMLWYINKIQKEISEQSINNPLNEAKIEAIKLNNEKKKIELEEKARTLLNAEEVTLAFVSTVKMIGRNLDALAPRLTKMLGGNSEMLLTIKNEINSVRTLIAETSPEDVLSSYNEQIEETE